MNGITFAVCAGGLDKPHETAQSLSAQGVRVIEAGADFFYHSSPQQIADSIGALQDYRIRVRSVHAPFGKDCNPM